MSWQDREISLDISRVSSHDKISPSSVNGEVTWMTDGYQEMAEMEERIKGYVGSQSSLTIVHIMGRKEVELEFSGNVAFVDLESKQRVVLSPKAYAERYKASLGKHHYDLTQLCYRYGAQYQKVYLQDDPKDVLRHLLNIHR